MAKITTTLGSNPNKWTADTVEQAAAQLSDPDSPPRLDVKASAAAMRHDLRAIFGQPFSVRMSRGTGYGWVYVEWFDGPQHGQVRERTFTYQSRDFDGMTDSYRQVNTNAPVRYSLRGVIHRRMIGDKGRRTVAGIFAKVGIEDVDAPMHPGAKDMLGSFSAGRTLSDDEQQRLVRELGIAHAPGHALSDAQSAAAYIHQHLDFTVDPPALHNHH